MIRSLLLAITLMMMLVPARAETLPPVDKAAVEQAITGQLNAFATDQGDTAYGFAAPVVQMAFPSVDGFMRMVREGYQPVYRNSGFKFTDQFTDGLGRPAQKVVIAGADGKTYEAVYFMEKQPDGTWKIAGCVIRVLPGTGV